jgi:hypothetical protein
MSYALADLVDFTRDIGTQDIGILLQENALAGELTACATKFVKASRTIILDLPCSILANNKHMRLKG